MEMEKNYSIQGVSEGLIFEVIARAMAEGYNIALYIYPAVPGAGAELKIEPEPCATPAANDGPRREKESVSSQKHGRPAVAAKRGERIGSDGLDQRIREAWKPGMTLKDLAKASGSSYDSISKIYKKVLSPEQVAGIKATAQKVRLEGMKKHREGAKETASPGGDGDDDGDRVSPEYRKALREQFHYEHDNPIF
jgi:hypothetical protein